MSKSWLALVFLPFLMACAASTPGLQTAEKQCTNVEQDTTESHIKVKSQCSSRAEGSSVNPLNQTETRPAPQ